MKFPYTLHPTPNTRLCRGVGANGIRPYEQECPSSAIRGLGNRKLFKTTLTD
ncbi:MAG: hypothetical protein F6J93_31790 [Oscillatoria sp. SIO1A7]|nr:hypothetical protein [Oscillatoria sp. SIO1A7]